MTIDGLLRYGNDVIYHKLQWPDKLQLLDTCNRGNLPYKMTVFDKIAVDILLADHVALISHMNLEGIIQMIAHVKSITSSQ